MTMQPLRVLPRWGDSRDRFGISDIKWVHVGFFPVEIVFDLILEIGRLEDFRMPLSLLELNNSLRRDPNKMQATKKTNI